MLINCTVYQDGTKLREIPVEDISDYVAKPESLLWVALRDATPEELAQMQEEFGLHELAVEDAHHGHQRPKIEEYGDMLFAVMHMVEPDSQGELRVGELAVFVGRNFVLSVRNRSERRLLGVRERCEREPHHLREGAGFIFYALMDAVVDAYFPVLDALESELDVIEQDMFAKGRARSSIQRLYDLKSKTMVLRHAVTPLMDAVGKLYGGRVPAVCVGSDHYYRDVHDHLARINGALDSLRDTIATAIQVSLSSVALEQNEVNKKLAAWAGIFAVVTAFAGIWGMNFKHMPELETPWGYPLALAVMVGVSGLLYRRFKRSGWL